MELINPVSNFIQSLTLRAFSDWRVTGRENVPPMGPLIIVANHLSYLDGSLLSTSISRKTWFLAKKGLFKWPVSSWFFRSYGAFPLDRKRADPGAFRWALGQLHRGQAIVLFPEGTRSRGAMRKAQNGVTRLALAAQTPLLPVGITGTERLGSMLRILKPTGEIQVNIGTTFSMPSIDGKPSPAVLGSLTDMIMERIAALLPDSYRGVYGAGGPKTPAPPALAGHHVEESGELGV